MRLKGLLRPILARLSGARVVLLNEILARSLWPNQDAVGRQIKWGGPEAPTPWMTIIGVVGGYFLRKAAC